MNIIKKKWLLSLVLVMVLSVVAVGCTDNTEDKVDKVVDDAKESVDDATEDVRKTTYNDIKFTPEEAFDKFMELHPEAKIESLDLDKGLMDYQYVVEGYDTENEYEVKINPVNGEVISDETEMAELDDENGEITKEHLAKVDSLIDKAKAEDASDSELDEWDISVDDGRVVIDIEIGTIEYSYDMDTEELIEKDM
ncbi:MAG: PepSY domain-containing protein [Senegalia sp. (in: firmicutes)]